MPAFSAQYQFAAEFIVFLVALAGLALVVLRGEPLTTRRSARVALAAGFVGIGASSFLQGSLLYAEAVPLAALRGAGVIALVVGSLNWRGSALSRGLLWAGSGALLLSVPLGLPRQDSAVATSVAALGGLLLGAALLNASRRAIAARVAASAAGTLLLIVLVLSVALSTVLATTVEDQALEALDDRALAEAAAIEARNGEMVNHATVVAALLVLRRSDPSDPSSPLLLSQLDGRSPPSAAQVAAITDELERARRDIYGENIAFAYVSDAQRVVAGSGASDEVLAGVAASDLVSDALQESPRRGGAIVVDGRAFNVGVHPVRLRSEAGSAPFGAVVALFALDEEYLQGRVQQGGDALALVDGSRTLARAGGLPAGDVLDQISSDVLTGAIRSDALTEEQFAAARPVRAAGDQQPVLALVAARSTDRADDLREDLFRTFFVIAFGGTVLALLLAALVGDRIGAGIRRLTSSAEAIQLGALGVRSGVRSEDEVGVLGATFDSMAASIEQQTDELQAAAARVEAILAGMGEALIAVDADGVVTDFNAAAEELLDRPAEEAIGRPVDQIVTLVRDDGSDLTPRLRSRELDRWSALGDVITPGNEPVPVAVTAGTLRGPDEDVDGGVIVLRDLRGEREVERMKRHFLSRVGHELRTPLTPLIGYSQLLAGRDLPRERAKPVYESILSSARKLERIVEMLEFFASLDAGRQVLHPEVVDVRDVLGAVVDRRAAAAQDGHIITKRVSGDTPAVVADGRWLGRSVEELVDNAEKFSPNGGRVVVSARPAPDAPGLVEIAVRDEGVGMSADEVERAFAEWSQGDESDTRHFGGLGLGLALVQRVAEHHGGRVACTTAPGKGAKFSILLPAAPAIEAVEEPAPAGRTRRRRRTPPTPAGGDGSPAGEDPAT